MSSLKELRGRINSVKSTQQITKAMKMVAAAKLKKAQQRITQLRPYAKRLNEILANVCSSLGEDVENKYQEQREEKNVLLVVFSSDKGLCGAFNNQLFKHVLHVVEEQYAAQRDSGNLYILPVGSKGRDYFSKRDYPLIEDYVDYFNYLDFENVKEIAERIMGDFAQRKFDKVLLFYNEFKNAATYYQRDEQFLPIQELGEEEEESSGDYIYEPSIEYIVEELIPKSLKTQFYKAMLDSNASEHGARMTAMDKATDNAEELLGELRLTYNRQRQAAITKEILEISAGAEALS